ncbi:biliverdin-producing heme oxygenase [Aliidiomarina sp. Khilg15.8]
MPLLQQLRQASLPAHRTIEQQPWLRALLHPTLDKATYARVLHCFRLFYQQADARIGEADTQALAGYRYVPRTPYLVADCEALADEFWPSVEPAPALSPQPDLETLVGWLYVIEGSSQGGQIIRPRVERTLGLTGMAGLQFFTRFAAAESEWPSFQACIQTLETDAVQSLKAHRIMDSSCRFFANLDDFFTICSEAWGNRSQYG